MSTELLEKTFKKWRFDPYLFVTEAIGAKPSNQQTEGLLAVKALVNAKWKKHMKQRMTAEEKELALKLGITIRSGHGCHARDSLILMHSGDIRKVQDIRVGDSLMGDDYSPRKVLSLYKGKENLYRVKYLDGSYYDVNESHILSLVAIVAHEDKKVGDITNVSLRDFIKWEYYKQSINLGYKKFNNKVTPKNISIELLGVGYYYGFEINGNNLYLLGDYTVTHNTGKDVFLAWVLIWMLVCFPHSNGMSTAPTGHTLMDVLWPYLRKWLRRSKIHLDKFVEVQSDKMYMKGAKGEWFSVARSIAKNASSDQQGEALAGRHNPYFIRAVDEASGVGDAVFKPIEGSMTGIIDYAILISNPTRNSGYFHSTHTKYRKFWCCLHWDAELSDVDEVSGETNTRDQNKTMAAKYGKDSNFYKIRVKGDFPASESDVFIPYEWIIEASERTIEQTPGAYGKVMGVDPAWKGNDKSIILMREGGIVLPKIYEYKKLDTFELAEWTKLVITEEDPKIGGIDTIGYGAGVYDNLRHSDFRSKVRSVNTSRESSDKIRYPRLRDELWWRMRKRFEEGTISIPKDDELIGELASVRFEYKGEKAIKIFSKEKLKLMGLPSPNKADALALTFFFNDRVYMQKPKDEWDDDDEYESLKNSGNNDKSYMGV